MIITDDTFKNFSVGFCKVNCVFCKRVKVFLIIYNYKSFNSEVKDVDTKQGVVTGYFSAFGNVDSDGDIMMPGAFKRSIQDWGPEGKGGDLYKQARALSRAYKTEFQDTPAVAKITAMKRGTTQRQVALEDLVDTVMLKGTGEDVRQLFASLERMGPEGQVMINDLRGYVAEAIKNQATKGVQRDINGKPYLETKTLDTIIKNLDKSKKLEFLFGKKGAEQYRTINDAVKDLQTIPKETTNPSGTAAQILAGLAEMGGQYAMTGIPVPLLSLAKKGVDIRQQQKQMKKIREFLDYGNKKD